MADGLECKRGQDWVRAEVCFILFFCWGGKEFECEKRFILLMKDHGAGAGGLSLGENLNTFNSLENCFHGNICSYWIKTYFPGRGRRGQPGAVDRRRFGGRLSPRQGPRVHAAGMVILGSKYFGIPQKEIGILKIFAFAG